LTAPLSNSYARVGRGGFSANLDNSTSRTWGYMRFYQSNGNHYITDGFRSTDETTGFRLSQNFALSREMTAEVGSDVVHYGGHARNVTGKLDYGEHSMTSAAGFSRLQWTPTLRARFPCGRALRRPTPLPAPHGPGSRRELHAQGRIHCGGVRFARLPQSHDRELYLFRAPNPACSKPRITCGTTRRACTPARRERRREPHGYYADLSDMVVTQGPLSEPTPFERGAAL
jgi:hypothetical protein